MEEIIIELRKIRKDLDEQRNTIEKSVDKITEQVTINVNNILEEKFKLLNENYENLKEKNENQEKRLYFLEKQARETNIVFFGIKETETSYAHLESNIINFIKEHFSQELDRRDIQAVKRIGKKGEKPRPIIVTFSTLGTKIILFKQRNTLKDTGFYIKEDFPQDILKKRKILQEQAKIEKEKGNLVQIKYDKLIIQENNRKHTSNKRVLSTSPPNYDTYTTESNKQASKKNKTRTPIQRTSSLSEGISKPGMLNYLINVDPKNIPGPSGNKNGNI
ncbi:uncharacterized protein LOC111348241 [Spodoptera litura]|uniref:Uncharacterized protein LOC111348241 n=1 Tax=Spodoptera litura TaxID=69820 RepID=A0A9J7DNR0_SPOLT|nr:uncharacterized protein LOC111348241 [Spodoptera litura]